MFSGISCPLTKPQWAQDSSGDDTPLAIQVLTIIHCKNKHSLVHTNGNDLIFQQAANTVQHLSTKHAEKNCILLNVKYQTSTSNNTKCTSHQEKN